MMNILDNAIDSIRLGVEDFRKKDPRRTLSAFRNLYAGILLLFKHKLAVLSQNDDSALIKQNLQPVIRRGRIRWIGSGHKTVDLPQIRERFLSLGIAVDWRKIEEVQKYRNEIEHYYISAQQSAVRKHLSDCFIVIRDFLVVHLKLDPRKLLGNRTWGYLLAEQQVYATEKKECTRQLDELKWPNDTAYLWISAATCRNCGGDLIRPRPASGKDADKAIFECVACVRSWEYEELLELSESPHSRFHDPKDGDYPPVCVCPECGKEGFDMQEDECVFCGTQGPFECSRCQGSIPAPEVSWENTSLCCYCAHQMSKDD
jgi:hypothetical protein